MATAVQDQAFEQEARRHYRWNFTVNFLDGTFFWFSFSFISLTTILPVFVSHLTENPLLIGLVAGIYHTGWFLPQLLTANYVEQLPRKKPFLVRINLLGERLGIWLIASSALLALYASPQWTLIAFYIAIIWASVGAGLSATAWQEMLAKVIPVRHRGRFFGITNFTGGAAGAIGALGAAYILDAYAFPLNFALCFIISGVITVISWFFLTLTREPPLPSRKPPVPHREYWQRLPQVVRRDRNFTRYMIARCIMMLGNMAVGFVAVYAVRQFDLPMRQVGFYTSIMLASMTLANLIFGTLADRTGHKLTLQMAGACGALAFLLALVAPGPEWFFLVFALLGAKEAGTMLSGMVIVFEFTPADDRPTYIGLANSAQGVITIVAPLLGGAIVNLLGFSVLFFVAMSVVGAGVALMYLWVREPRFAGQLAGS